MAKYYLKFITSVLYLLLYTALIIFKRFKALFVSIGFLLITLLSFLLSFAKQPPQMLLHYDQDQTLMINQNQRHFLLEKWQKILNIQPNSQTIIQQLNILENK